MVNVAPVYRRGLFDMLRERGYLPAEPVSVEEWASRTPHTASLIGVITREDLLTLRRVVDTVHDGIVVGLLKDPEPHTYVAGLLLGADALVDMDASAEQIARTLEAAWRHEVLLPRQIALEVARGLHDSQVLIVDEARLNWLRRLAEGTTVEQLAREVGYSRRAMFRQLELLYREMGAPCRTAAILTAARCGLL